MAIGMSYDQFWYEDSALVKMYYQAHKYRIEQRNQEMWMQGLYICSALECTVGNLFKKKGSSPIEYMKEPLQIFPKTEKQIKAETEKERAKAIESFKKLQKNVQSHINKENT